jgi:hypothetical protein
MIPVTPDLAVVNCEPTVRVFILLPFRPRGTILILYHRLGDVSIMPEKQSNVKLLATFFLQSFGGFFVGIVHRQIRSFGADHIPARE